MPWSTCGFDSRWPLSQIGTCSWASSQAPTLTPRVRFLPSLLTPCDAAGAAACLSRRCDGFESRTGRCFRAEAKWCGNRLIRGSGQVRFLPARLSFTPVAQRQRHLPDVEATRRFESCREYCGVDWSLVPARSHKPYHAGSNPASATGIWERMYQGGEAALQAAWMGSIPIVSTELRGVAGYGSPGQFAKLCGHAP